MPVVTFNGLAGFTSEGGFVVRKINKTGAPSVKGTLVDPGTITNSFTLTESDDFDCIGAVYEDGIADGSLCWVVVGGRGQVKLENNVGSTIGNWVRTSVTTAGRADASTAAPPGHVASHFAEIGHCDETVSGDANGALCYVMLHFN